MSYKKALIIGQPFNDITGGGITLSNLFKGWPKDKIAVAATGHFLYTVTTDICDTYYQLGKEEHKWSFPFNKLQRPFPSGIKTFEHTRTTTTKHHINPLRYLFVNHVFYPFLSFFGLLNNASKIILSDEFKVWLDEYKPEVLYLQVHSLETIVFAQNLIDYLKIPSAIHFMDDWPSTINNKSILKKYWNKKIDQELKKLLNKVSLHLSISDAMGKEYTRRYHKDFIAFHNPIELTSWMKHTKTSFDLKGNTIKILYSGRIGIGIASSLYEVAKAIDAMNEQDDRIRLFIQSPTEEKIVLSRLSGFKCVTINPTVEYNKLPVIFSDADLLLLANDFNEKGMAYLKYSMPTKASEYMISGTPVFLYTPKESAVYQVFEKNGCAYCLNVQDTDEVIKSIQFLIDNKDYRKKISTNAVNYAKENFNADKVRENFHSALIEL